MSDQRIPQILELIKKGQYNWNTYGDLSQHDRRLCVQFLRTESNLTQTRMSVLLRVTLRCIQKDIAYLNATCASRFPRDDLYAIFDMFFSEFFVQKERARAGKNFALEWAITTDFFDRLKEFGILQPIKGDKDAPQFGDIIFGNKMVQNNQTNNNAFLLANNLDAGQKTKIRAALVSSGLAQTKTETA